MSSKNNHHFVLTGVSNDAMPSAVALDSTNATMESTIHMNIAKRVLKTMQTKRRALEAKIMVSNQHMTAKVGDLAVVKMNSGNALSATWQWSRAWQYH